jgi:hypothetical protein
MPFTEVFAGIAVLNRDAAIEFYERPLGAPREPSRRPVMSIR